MNVSLTQKQRILSVDILRGAVMLIMALDHVRDFFHIHAWDDSPTNLLTTTPLLFFTRWITHFCAPVFVFLSGISAFLAGQKRTKKEQSLFLIKRGVWLILVEIVVMALTLTFNPLYNLIILQVIWAIGCSMIILGLLARTSLTVIAVTGCILFFLHNILDYITLPQEGIANVLWTVLLTSKQHFFSIAAQRSIFDVYAILPWTGAMLLGYTFGTYYRTSVDAARRKKVLLAAGVFLTVLFISLRYINQYGDPEPWAQQKDAVFTFLSFLNTTKYPPSLDYLCMTIGPALILLAFIEHMQNKLSKVLIVYGRVPFFYYVIHFFLIHTVCVVFFYATGHGTKDIIDPDSPFFFRPVHFGYDLGIVYLVWLFIITVLYWPCKWFNKYKATHNQWWLSYV
ncbi:MAG TPA: heparan-alpha-glucosaminide N-acetyltransferase domain-containing protein [Panacibacter sp.]|nr:heparan-alpha-glucosaminide N-acetyltransferase domain-containing protein [Panacibacter sp.]